MCSIKKIIRLLDLILFSTMTTVAWADTPPLDWKLYGKIKATTLYSNHPLESFANINSSAPTAAAFTDSTNTFSENDLYTFQVAQSRFGIDILKQNVSGNFEFDFINFSQSTPTTEMRPRVRKALVKYQINDQQSLQFGLDWDTFSPLAPQVLNYVGLHFNSGNLGFMRQQVKWNMSLSSEIKSEVSIGFPGKNPNPTVDTHEQTSTPTLAYKLSYENIGVSFITAKIKGTTDNSIFGWNLFFDKTFLESWRIITEFQGGQNLGDLATLALSKHYSTGSIHEFTGFLNLIKTTKNLGDFSIVFSRSELLENAPVTAYSFDTTTKTISSEGILYNQTERLYWKFPLTDDLSLGTELSWYQTKRKLTTGETLNRGFSMETGFLFVF